MRTPCPHTASQVLFDDYYAGPACGGPHAPVRAGDKAAAAPAASGSLAAARAAAAFARSRHLAKTFEGEEGMAPRVLHRPARNKPQLNLSTLDIPGAQSKPQNAIERPRNTDPLDPQYCLPSCPEVPAPPPPPPRRDPLDISDIRGAAARPRARRRESRLGVDDIDGARAGWRAQRLLQLQAVAGGAAAGGAPLSLPLPPPPPRTGALDVGDINTGRRRPRARSSAGRGCLEKGDPGGPRRPRPVGPRARPEERDNSLRTFDIIGVALRPPTAPPGGAPAPGQQQHQQRHGPAGDVEGSHPARRDLAALFQTRLASAARRDAAAAEAARALASLAASAPPAAAQRLQAAARALDRDGSGLLTADEAARALSEARVGASEAVVAAVLGGLADNAGLVDYRRLAARLAAAREAARPAAPADGPGGGGRRPATASAALGGAPALRAGLRSRLRPDGQPLLLERFEGAAAASASEAAPGPLEQRRPRRQSAEWGEEEQRADLNISSSRGGGASLQADLPAAGMGAAMPAVAATVAQAAVAALWPAQLARGHSSGGRPSSAPAKLLARSTAAGTAAPVQLFVQQQPQLHSLQPQSLQLPPQQQEQPQQQDEEPPALRSHLAYIFNGGAGCAEAARAWLPCSDPLDDGFGRKPFLGDSRPLDPATLAALAAATAPVAWVRAAAGRGWLLQEGLGRERLRGSSLWAAAAEAATAAAEAGSGGATGDGGGGEGGWRPASAGGAAISRPCGSCGAGGSFQTGPGAGSGAPHPPRPRPASARPAAALVSPGYATAPRVAAAATARPRSAGCARPRAPGCGRGVGLFEARRDWETAAGDVATIRCLQ
ncbi:hypothetical protein Rsub_03340 [Raphidocelis subcapitata]|uniref:EF-hand domain-containing protein n=1 Tax=Raphidocelis subcapitata TaxID=307507 RepID=A0A2V0NZ57_9CHLO|nr:hypothetical protein Rsub_03340 [Raphidocelis subcapitata]|eukprot:GBF90207.1 hypothetical protein Rsub_03340 [Raphidocelis subcapitata]